MGVHPIMTRLKCPNCGDQEWFELHLEGDTGAYYYGEDDNAVFAICSECNTYFRGEISLRNLREVGTFVHDHYEVVMKL